MRGWLLSRLKSTSCLCRLSYAISTVGRLAISQKTISGFLTMENRGPSRASRRLSAQREHERTTRTRRQRQGPAQNGQAQMVERIVANDISSIYSTTSIPGSPTWPRFARQPSAILRTTSLPEITHQSTVSQARPRWSSRPIGRGLKVRSKLRWGQLAGSGGMQCQDVSYYIADL